MPFSLIFFKRPKILGKEILDYGDRTSSGYYVRVLFMEEENEKLLKKSIGKPKTKWILVISLF